MTQPEALRLADVLEHKAIHENGTMLEMSCAAELRRLSAERDALLRILKSELQHAEWQDKIIHPYRGESWQNWKISIYLPVPLSASDKTPQAALDRLVDAAIKVAEGEAK